MTFGDLEFGDGFFGFTPFQATTQGLLMGAGTKLEFDSPIEGFGILPARGNNPPRPRRHGTRPIRQFSPDRPLRWRIRVLGDDVDDALDLIADIGAAWAPLDAAVNVALGIRIHGDRDWVLFGQPGRTAPDLTRLPQASPIVAVEWVATDPRIYTDAVTEQSTSLGASSGGLGLPHGFPHGFGTAVSGQINTAHEGTVPTTWEATITAGAGGLDSPSLLLGSTGQQLEFIIHLDEGQTLELDQREETVLLNGTADRSNTINRPTADDFFEIPPAADVVAFGGSGNGTLTLRYRPAWQF
jgi:hypothetical protein